MTDEELVAKLVAGDQAAAGELFQRYGKRVRQTIKNTTKGDSSIEEQLVQDIFIRVFQKAALFDSTKGTFVAWLTTIARNEAADHYRKQERTAAALDDGVDAVKSSEPVVPASQEDVSKKEVASKLLENMDLLSEPARTILKLRIVEGKSFKQIAKAMMQPLDTVKTIFYRNTEMLRIQSQGHQEV